MASSLILDFVAPDWESPVWMDGFYPDDLPAAWRLAYYANEFSAVLLPAARWVTATAEEWADWGADTSARFRFYLELPPRPSSPPILDVACRLLGERLAGGLVTGPVVGKESALVAGLPLYRLIEADVPQDLAGCLPAVSPPDSGAGDLRAARAWLSGLDRGFRSGPMLVVLNGERAGAAALRRWWQLAWLMGLA